MSGIRWRRQNQYASHNNCPILVILNNAMLLSITDHEEYLPTTLNMSFKYYLICISVHVCLCLYLCMSVSLLSNATFGWGESQQRPEEDNGYPRAGTAGGSEAPLHGCWEPSLSPLEEQETLLTAVHLSSLANLPSTDFPASSSPFRYFVTCKMIRLNGLCSSFLFYFPETQWLVGPFLPKFIFPHNSEIPWFDNILESLSVLTDILLWALGLCSVCRICK